MTTPSKLATLATFLVAASLPISSHAAIITPVNQDIPGQGLNDPTPRKPEGGNPGLTVGEQRRIAYQYAADLWSALIHSDVEIIVSASFRELPCTESIAVMGAAGPSWIDGKPPSEEKPGMIVPGALANALHGSRITSGIPDNDDIRSVFNANIGKHDSYGNPCLLGSDWYYGLDGNTPTNSSNFIFTLMHEIAHGLGFISYNDLATGQLNDLFWFYEGYSDPFTDNIYDNGRNKYFTDPTMTDRDRQVAIYTHGRPAWGGSNVKSLVPQWLSPARKLVLSGTSDSLSIDDFGSINAAKVGKSSFKGPLALVNDDVGQDTGDACEALPSDSLRGKIVFINRGTCTWFAKVINAQNAGAIGAIIGNVPESNLPDSIPMFIDFSGSGVAIPAIAVNLSNANQIRFALENGTPRNASLEQVPNRFAGADIAGRPLIYAPDPPALGSSLSHFDSGLVPEALMAPQLTDNADATLSVDLTLGLFRDIGWKLNEGNAHIGTCDTGVKMFKNPGLIAGANVQAQDRLCRTGARGNRSQYLRCMNDTATELRDVGMISGIEQAGIRTCAAKVGAL